MKLTQVEDDAPQDNYKGASGWIVVAVGEHGRACVLDYDLGFGALRFLLCELGLSDPVDELGLDVPEDPGVYRAQAKAWTTGPAQGYDDHDMGINVVGEWSAVANWKQEEDAQEEEALLTFSWDRVTGTVLARCKACPWFRSNSGQANDEEARDKVVTIVTRQHLKSCARTSSVAAILLADEACALRHMLGADSKKPGFRNYFNACEGDALMESMEAKGMVKRGRNVVGGSVNWHATPVWCALVLGKERA